MSRADAGLFQVPRPLYPERVDHVPEGWIEEKGLEVAGSIARRFAARPSRMRDFVAAVHVQAARYAGLDLPGLGAAARELRKELRRDGLEDALVARAFALIRETSGVVLGMRHFDCQLQGGWVMVNGMIAEMNTGEGKTLTATLPACTMALAGVPVHVITVNDYLVSRDAEIMKPVYEALGLSVGVVVEKQQPPERQAAYRCDVTYATNKVLVFDYLRDRITLGQRDSALHLHMERLYGGEARIRKLLMRGLSFAVVDEADSVLVDEARTPLIISAPAKADDEALVAQKGLELARELSAERDFVLLEDERRAVLTDVGKRRLDELCAGLGGVWKGLLRREELATQALAALHLFKRDVHYIVREGKVQIVDEHTGRVMADRSWQRGLHQLVECKEGVEITAQKEPLARISYQRFFRRYLRFGGMTGTGSEVAGELGSVYGLAVVRIPPNRPIQRRTLPPQVHATEAEKWQAVARSVQEHHQRGQPVLVGTPSVATSETASRALGALGLAHVVLNAKQDKEEAAIVERAGEAGRITVATNMAGRGTDIKLAKGVAEAGGLHVILCERHDSARVDRQLEGRCGRQGDPGTFASILSLEDHLPTVHGGLLYRGFAAWAKRAGEEKRRQLGAWAIRLTQKRVERAHSRERRGLLKADRQTVKMLSFSGRSE
jgi:preprotein translocase subunit SecA